MPRHRPDPGQTLFRFVWSDPSDDRPDDQADTDPPLRERLDTIRERWGWEARFCQKGAYPCRRSKI
jgi:hypothetical protein